LRLAESRESRYASRLRAGRKKTYWKDRKKAT